MTDPLAGTVTATGVRHLPDGRRTFVERNTAGVRHSAYAVLALTPAAAEMADTLRELVPVYDAADEPALQAFAMVMVRVRAASAALEQAEPGELPHLSRDLHRWLTTALKYSDQFGMTPRSRVALGLDLVRGQAASLTLTRLAQMADDSKAS
ncbi:MAG: hypothetical protein AB7O78_09870 [Thermoleophilia bacterium]